MKFIFVFEERVFGDGSDSESSYSDDMEDFGDIKGYDDDDEDYYWTRNIEGQKSFFIHLTEKYSICFVCLLMIYAFPVRWLCTEWSEK